MMAHALQIKANPYPQKLDWHDMPFLERLGERIRTWGLSKYLTHSSELDRFVRAVEQAGRSAAIMDAASRSLSVRDLSLKLRHRGLDDAATVARCFALVRQLSIEILGLAHFPTQIKGGYLLLKGFIAEMDTGEGKTLTATLATATAALSGMQVHIVTVNDYLARRDYEYLSPLYHAMGLSTSLIPEGVGQADKKIAYRANIVFCTNKTVVFDYLRDRMELGTHMNPLSLHLDALIGEQGGGGGHHGVSMRGLQFVVVDEADSVFIDEARTPLILSAARADAAAESFYREAVALARQLVVGEDFKYHHEARRAELIPAGKERVKDMVQAEGYSPLWNGTRRREEVIEQALTGLHGFHRDYHYIVRNGKVMIVDENTGRVMPDRAWEKGLQQLIEVKENVAISPEKETLARISYQLFFRRYLRLSGMTGTCREVSGELGEAYGLAVVRVQPRKPSRRIKTGCRLFATAQERWDAVVEAVIKRVASGQAILVGTRSILASEHLSALLSERGVSHQVLNAKQDQEEALMVSRAGEEGMVTIATNMAGRGTDIKLSEQVKANGGLHVILTERHDNARVDRQLVGRCARQGDPGSWEELLSLEDELVRNYTPFVGSRLRRLLARNGSSRSVQKWVMTWYRLAQRHEERRHRHVRFSLLRSDFQTRRALSFSGQLE